MAMKHSDEFVWWAPKRKLGGGWIAFKDSPSQPQAPDPYAVADAQGKANLEAARLTASLNHVNQVTPFGSQTYSQGTNADGTPNDSWTATTTVDPKVQALIDAQLGVSGKLAGATSTAADRAVNALGQPLDLSSIPANQRLTYASGTVNQVAAPTATGIGNNVTSTAATGHNATADIAKALTAAAPERVNAGVVAVPKAAGFDPITGVPATASMNLATSQGVLAGPAQLQRDNLPTVQGVTGDTRQKVVDALYNQQTSRLDPRYQQSQSDLDARLAAQGITQGSQAYDREQQNLARDRNDAYSTAMNSAITGGGAEETRLQNLALATRGQLFGENAAVAGVEGQNADRSQTGSLTNAQMANALEAIRGNLALTAAEGSANRATQAQIAQAQLQAAQAQANADREARIATANADRGLTAGTFNSGLGADISKFNAGAGNTVNLANSALTTGVGVNNATRADAMDINNAARSDVTAISNADRLNTAQQNDANRLLQANTVNAGLAANQQQQNVTNQQNIAGFNDANRQQQLAETLALRNQPLNELNALRTGAAPSVPQFGVSPTGAAVAPAPIAQSLANNYQGQLNAYNTQVGSNNAITGGLASLGGSAMMALALSDRRLKSNITRVGTHPSGLPIYNYDILGTNQDGVMADEVAQVKPEAVLHHPSGFDMVDYAKL